MAGKLRGQLLQLAMMHTFEQAQEEARERTTSLLAALHREPAHGGVDKLPCASPIDERY